MTRVLLLLFALVGGAVPSIAAPQQEPDAARATRIGGEPGSPCVSVDIGGHVAGRVDCAAARLEAAARAAQARAKDDPSLAAPNATSSPLTVGLGSVAAASQRLGGDLRRTTSLPQRPVPSLPASAFPRRP